jgi:hypothetical protein
MEIFSEFGIRSTAYKLKKPNRGFTGSTGRIQNHTADVIDVTGVGGKRCNGFSCKEFER